jgi:hypothetical protein
MPFGVSIFLRQTIKMDRMGGWLEQDQNIQCYITDGESSVEVTGEDKRLLLRGLFNISVRKTAEPIEKIERSLISMEGEITQLLRRPSDDELTNQVRHAVTPLLAAIITT